MITNPEGEEAAVVLEVEEVVGAAEVTIISGMHLPQRLAHSRWGVLTVVHSTCCAFLVILFISKV